MWLLVTIGVFLVARIFCMKLKHPLVNPLFCSIAILIPLLLISETDYEHYNQQNELLVQLLGPAVVALALPLYTQLLMIRQNWKLILCCCAVGSLVSMLTGGIIAILLGADHAIVASVLGKSVTLPIALELTQQFEGIAIITVIFVLSAGLTGALFAYPIFNKLNITHPMARGLAMGSVSHAIGTATCAEKSPQDASFSSLAFILCGVCTSLLAPIAIAILHLLL